MIFFHLKEKYLSCPSFWLPVTKSLHTLSPKTWIDLSVLDYYLLSKWYEGHAEAFIRYIDSQTACGWNMDDAAAAHMEIYTIPRFRSCYFLPISCPCPIVPVAFVVLQGGHFFAVIMDYKKAQVYILGRSSVHGGDTAEW
jgi:hypothetical protein